MRRLHDKRKPYEIGKIFHLLGAILLNFSALSQTVTNWDQTISYRNVLSPDAQKNVVARNGFGITNEGVISYWLGSSGGKLTQKFSFPRNIEKAYLRLNYIYSWGGSGSVWASKDGINWTQILDAPSKGTPVGYDYENDLPSEVMGGNEIWIEARKSSGSTWQFLRYDTRNRTDNAFELKVKFQDNATVPVIVTQPQDQSINSGNDATFCVQLEKPGNYNYQWQHNEVNILGATLNCYTINSLTSQLDGSRYRVIVSASAGTVISDSATLTVVSPPPPIITKQPISKSPAEGSQLSFNVTATGIGTLTYQWQINGQDIPGATSDTLLMSAVRPTINGTYRVLVSNPYGTTISSEALVTVVVTDRDSDGLSDYEEILFATNPNKADTDGDGLTDLDEVITHASNPLNTDSDGDGYSDGIEVARDGDPNDQSVMPTGALAIFPAIDIEFYTLKGVKYQLEMSADFTVWTAVGGTIIGNGGNQNHLIRAREETQFWRLHVVE